MVSSPKRKRREKKKISSPKRKRVSKKRGSKKRSPPSWKPGRLRRKQFRVPKNNLKRIKSIFLVKTPIRLQRSYVTTREAQQARQASPVVRRSIVRAATKAPSFVYATPKGQSIKTINLITPRSNRRRSLLRRSPLPTIQSAETIVGEEY